MEPWIPIRFDPDVERAYAKHLLARFIPLGRLGFGIGALAFVGYGFWDLMLDPNAWEKTGPVRLAAAFHFCACIGLTFLPTIRRNPSHWPILVFYTYSVYAFLYAVILSKLPGGFLAGVGGWPLGLIFITAVTSGVRQAAGTLIPFLLVAVLVMSLLGSSAFELINMLAWTGGGVGFAIGFAYMLDVINRRAFHLERQLDIEKQRSEALLLNILPAGIAARLKAQEEPVADSHESVSVLFTDLADFTEISRQMSAAELVTLLNDLFSRFDELVDKHGAEKIKTIGDSYMVVAGLTGSGSDHAERIADLALAMLQAFREFRRDNNVALKLRIGVHSGAVVAGVIGKRKFSYDIWGNTVNVASRMESEGVGDRIQISEETLKLLPDRFLTTPRGEIQVKGHRPRATHFLQSGECTSETP